MSSSETFISPIAFTTVCKSFWASVLTGRCCGGAEFDVDEEEDEDAEFWPTAEALLRLTVVGVVAEAPLGLAEMEASEACSCVEEWVEGMSAGSAAAAAASSEMEMMMTSGSSRPVGRDRESATTLAFPST